MSLTVLILHSRPLTFFFYPEAAAMFSVGSLQEIILRFISFGTSFSELQVKFSNASEGFGSEKFLLLFLLLHRILLHLLQARLGTRVCF